MKFPSDKKERNRLFIFFSWCLGIPRNALEHNAKIRGNFRALSSAPAGLFLKKLNNKAGATATEYSTVFFAITAADTSRIFSGPSGRHLDSICLCLYACVCVCVFVRVYLWARVFISFRFISFTLRATKDNEGERQQGQRPAAVGGAKYNGKQMKTKIVRHCWG